MTSTALMFGYDKLLNDTRCRILEQAGISVVQTSDMSLVEQSISARKMGILVLCHTVPEQLSDHLFHRAQELHPEMKTIRLYKFRPPAHENPLHRTIGAMDGPTRLTETIHTLLDGAN